MELVRRAFERWNQGDREVRGEDVHPDVEVHSRMLGGVVRGTDGLKSWFREIDQQFDGWRLGLGEIREAADRDRLLVLGEIHLHGRGSDVEFDQPMAWLMDFRDGRLVRMQMFTDRTEALKAAGLGE